MALRSSTNVEVLPPEKAPQSGHPRPESTNSVKPYIPNHDLKGHAFVVHECSKTTFLDAQKQVNYEGLFNLAGLVLFITNFRLVIENLLKYGLLFGSYFFTMSLSNWIKLPCFIGAIGFFLYIFIAFGLEKYLASAARQAKQATGNAAPPSPERLCAIISSLNVGLILIVPSVIGLFTSTEPLYTFILMFLSMILFMKLISYHLVNQEYREEYLKPGSTLLSSTSSGVTVGEDKSIRYPANLTLGNIFYFLAAPTLCYQLEYPRAPRIRWSRVGGLVAQYCFITTLMLFMIEQYLVPTVVNSIEPFNKQQLGRIIERILKLSIPNLYIWLLMFYGFFHVWLNLTAELLRFGDREFYHDWWNSTTLSDYWRTWNIPVHVWMVRHVYYPLRRLGYGSLAASFLIFALSGIGHEMLISIPCHTFQLYVFISFMAQIPLIYVTKTWLKGTVWGNLLFWFFFCVLGQPMCILIYTHLVVNHYHYLYWVFF